MEIALTIVVAVILIEVSVGFGCAQPLCGMIQALLEVGDTGLTGAQVGVVASDERASPVADQS
jgi:hypothetical protein